MQKSDLSDINPVLSKDAVIHKVTDEEYVIHQTRLSHQVRINKFSFQLLSLLDGRKSIVTISDEISALVQQRVDPGDIYDLLYGKLFGLGFIDDNPEAIQRKSSNYLALRFTLLPKPLVKSLSSRFYFLFPGTKFFNWLFIVLLGFLVINIVYFFKRLIAAKHTFYIDNTALLLFFLFSFLICLFHEIGHASALRSYRKNAGDIGVGFFLFYPVFYCDVSEAWFLKKAERVVVNLGGIYFELLAATLFILAMYLTGNMIYVCLASIILFRAALNLNPFLRRDGYWILSDLTGRPNLQRTAIAHFFSRLSGLFHKRNNEDRFNGFLFTYGMLSLSFVVLFLLFMVVFKSSSILYFPFRIKQILAEIPGGGLELRSVPYLLQHVGLPLLFYYLLLRLLIRLIRNWLKSPAGGKKAN